MAKPSTRNVKARTHKHQSRKLEITEEQIRLRAYELYIERKDAPGSALEDWLQAERELVG